jgi:hypothetical protein
VGRCWAVVWWDRIDLLELVIDGGRPVLPSNPVDGARGGEAEVVALPMCSQVGEVTNPPDEITSPGAPPLRAYAIGWLSPRDSERQGQAASASADKRMSKVRATHQRVCRAYGRWSSSPAGGVARMRPGGRPMRTRTRTGRRNLDQLTILRRGTQPWRSRWCRDTGR